MGKFESMEFRPVKCWVYIDATHRPINEPSGFIDGRVQSRDANAMIVPLAPPGHEWVCVPKRKPSKAKRKGTRKESSK